MTPQTRPRFDLNPGYCCTTRHVDVIPEDIIEVITRENGGPPPPDAIPRAELCGRGAEARK